MDTSRSDAGHEKLRPRPCPHLTLNGLPAIGGEADFIKEVDTHKASLQAAELIIGEGLLHFLHLETGRGRTDPAIDDTRLFRIEGCARGVCVNREDALEFVPQLSITTLVPEHVTCQGVGQFLFNPLCGHVNDIIVFKDCQNLLTVIIKDGCKVISEGCFNGCIRLKSISIPESVTSIGDYAFNGCIALTKAVIGDGVTTIGQEAFNGCVKLNSLEIGAGVTKIAYRAFYGCTELEEVELPDNLETLENRAYSDNAETFANCTSLESVTIGSKLANMGYGVFSGCKQLV